jgi:hypothetical protein
VRLAAQFLARPWVVPSAQPLARPWEAWRELRLDIRRVKRSIRQESRVLIRLVPESEPPAVRLAAQFLARPWVVPSTQPLARPWEAWPELRLDTRRVRRSIRRQKRNWRQNLKTRPLVARYSKSDYEQPTNSRDRGSDSSPLVHRQPGVCRAIPTAFPGPSLCGTGWRQPASSPCVEARPSQVRSRASRRLKSHHRGFLDRSSQAREFRVASYKGQTRRPHPFFSSLLDSGSQTVRQHGLRIGRPADVRRKAGRRSRVPGPRRAHGGPHPAPRLAQRK